MDAPITQEIVVDLIKDRNAVIYSHNNDNNASNVICHIKENGVDFNIDEDYTITLLIRKASQTLATYIIGSEYTDEITKEKKIFGSFDNHNVYFPIIINMTLAPGRTECTLQFSKNGTVIHSAMFFLKVDKVAVTDDKIVDTDEFKSIHEEYEKYKKEIEALINSMSNEIASTTQPDSQKNGDFWLKLL